MMQQKEEQKYGFICIVPEGRFFIIVTTDHNGVVTAAESCRKADIVSYLNDGVNIMSERTFQLLRALRIGGFDVVIKPLPGQVVDYLANNLKPLGFARNSDFWEKAGGENLQVEKRVRDEIFRWFIRRFY